MAGRLAPVAAAGSNLAWIPAWQDRDGIIKCGFVRRGVHGEIPAKRAAQDQLSQPDGENR